MQATDVEMLVEEPVLRIDHILDGDRRESTTGRVGRRGGNTICQRINENSEVHRRVNEAVNA